MAISSGSSFDNESERINISNKKVFPAEKKNIIELLRLIHMSGVTKHGERLGLTQQFVEC
jgi:hypothetical protein